MTRQVPQIRASRTHERPAGFPRLDADARVGARTVCARTWSARAQITVSSRSDQEQAQLEQLSSQ